MKSQIDTSGYLLYCIYINNGQDRVKGLTGIQGQSIETISAKGLSAIISKITDPTTTTEIEELKQYGQVVAACHQTRTTIPMQYGSIFNDRSGIIAHLEKQSNFYKSLLRHLAGNEEMGIRLLLSEVPPPPFTNRNSANQQKSRPGRAQEFPCSGKAYLIHQKKRYGLADTFLQRAEQALAQWKSLFKGLYKECCCEKPEAIASNKTPILSINFLVNRQHIKNFKNTFVQISQTRPEKALLSGPWPPYNFVNQNKT